MITEENGCVGCSDVRGWCAGDSCPNRHIPVYICDNCGEECDELYRDDNGQELCEECFKDVIDDFKESRRITGR